MNNNLNVLMKRLTVISVVLGPLNIIAGIGGMSEYSHWTRGLPWPLAYALFAAGLGLVAWVTYRILKYAGMDADARRRRRRLGDFVRRLMRQHPPCA